MDSLRLTDGVGQIRAAEAAERLRDFRGEVFGCLGRRADPVAVGRWTEIEDPKIAAAAPAPGGTGFFGDEAGVRSDYHAGHYLGAGRADPSGACHRRPV